MRKLMGFPCWIVLLCILFSFSACGNSKEATPTAPPQMDFTTVEKLTEYFRKEENEKKSFPYTLASDAVPQRPRRVLFAPEVSKMQTLLGAELTYIAYTEALDTIDYHFSWQKEEDSLAGVSSMPTEQGREMTVSYIYGWPKRTAFLELNDPAVDTGWSKENGCYYRLETTADEADRACYTVMWSAKGTVILAFGVPAEKLNPLMDHRNQLFAWVPVE